MEYINSIASISSDWLNDLIKVDDLIYYDGPLLSHFQNMSGEDYLFYWVDTDESHNRWLIININVARLQDYLNGKLSLYKLITEVNNGLVYKVDIDSNIQYHNFELVEVDQLPSVYLPSPESYYNFKPLEQQIDLSSYSSKFNKGILQARFATSEKVGYGTIDAELFANSLIQLVTINKGLKKSFINTEKLSKKEGKERFDVSLLHQATTLNYIGNTRGSFGALFLPVGNEIAFPGTKSKEDTFVDYVIEFYESSSIVEVFKKYIGGLDKSVITSYKKLLKTITAAKTDFQLNYINTASRHKTSSVIGYKKAKMILQNLERLEFSESSEIKMTGRFTALNLNTGHYYFEDYEDETNSSRGYLDSDRREMAYKIKWARIYEIVIMRKEDITADSKEAKVTDLLISFVEQD